MTTGMVAKAYQTTANVTRKVNKAGNPNWYKGMPSPNPLGAVSAGESTLMQVKRFLGDGITPIEFLLIVMRKDERKLKALGIDPKDVRLGTRIDCANAVAPFVHRKLAQAMIAEDASNPDDTARRIIAAVQAIEVTSGATVDAD